MDRFERLTLEEDEADIEVEDEDVAEVEEEINPELCLVGRFLTRRTVRVHMMKLKMSDIWNPVRGVTIKSKDNGRFLFIFYHHRDVQKVLKGGPWFFEKHMLILGSMVGAESPAHVPLYTVPFWVQVHKLPSGLMSEKIGKQIAGAMGEFLEYDANNNSQL
ncbi:DUF4283 domain protein, partial [Trifolium medium]|nr:DUF4283 domain protein [Trifolium medium]